MNAKRFWARVKRGPGCWEWQGSTQRGYGAFWNGKKVARAHRVSWELINGPIAHGLGVLHKCDNPSCVRPAHLFLGDQIENMKDASLKGRLTIYRGNDNCNAKLTPQRLENLKQRRREGLSYRRLAQLFNISHTTARYACEGLSYKARGRRA